MQTLSKIHPLDRGKVTSCLKRKRKANNYKYVYKLQSPYGDVKWQMSITIDGHSSSKYYDTEAEAAKAADIILIRRGRKPVNVLKPI